jgi:O-antigen/teichoic acid export membrane protein
VFMSLAEAAVNLALSLWLVKSYGIVGVALGTAAAGFLTSNWYVIRIVCRELRMSPSSYLRVTAPALLTSIPTAFLGTALLRFYPVNGWASLFVEAAAIGFLYLVFYALLGLRVDERRLIYSRVRTTGRAIQTRLQEAF